MKTCSTQSNYYQAINMVSPKPVSPFFLTFALILFLFISPTHSTPSNVAKVDLSLYYEALCPFCGNFIVNQLDKVFETDLSSIVNLRLIPWGNARRVSNNSWTCQHGPNECLLNTVEACAINLWPDPKVHFKLIQCIERLSLGANQMQWPSCLKEQHLNQEVMNLCYRSATGYKLELRNAYETEHLQPPHKFVPWVLVNNKALKQDYQNYIAYVCETYTGPNRPAACNRPLERSSSDIKISATRVCYIRKTDNYFLSPEV